MIWVCHNEHVYDDFDRSDDCPHHYTVWLWRLLFRKGW